MSATRFLYALDPEKHKPLTTTVSLIPTDQKEAAGCAWVSGSSEN